MLAGLKRKTASGGGMLADPGRTLATDGPDAQRTRVRWVRLVAGLLVMAASIIAVWLVIQSQSSTVSVWVAASRVDAGTTLEQNHVVIRQVSSDSQLFAISSEAPVVGRVVRVTIPQGSTLTEGHFFASDDLVGSAGGQIGQASIAFEAGRIPSVVRVNDLLRLQVISGARSGEAVIQRFEQIPVLLVERVERGPIVVTVEIGADEGDRLLQALASGDAWAQIVGRR